MIVKFHDYTLGYRIVSFAKSKFAAEDLLDSGIEVIYFENNGLTLLPENVMLTVNVNDIEKLSHCSNYDVFEVSDNGNAYLYYNTQSADNAFLLSLKCNSNCIMCPVAENVRKTGHIANSQSLIKIASQIPIDAQHLTLTGGEPFLIGEGVFDFFEYLKGKFTHSDFLLLTNGRAFCSASFANRTRQTLPSNTIIGIPIHGHNAELHDHITQVKGSFDQTCKGIKNMLNLGCRIELRIVVSKLNYMHINEIADLIINEFPTTDCVKFMGLEMLGNAAKHCDDVWLPYPQAFNSSERAIDKLILNGIDVGIYNFPMCSVPSRYWGIYQKSISDYKIRYAANCDLCAMKNDCGGIFGGTIRLAKDDVIPFLEEKRC